MKTTEYYSFSESKALSRIPDITTERLQFNGLIYSEYRNPGLSLSVIYTVIKDSTDFVFLPISSPPGGLLESVILYQVTAVQPNSSIVLESTPKGQPPRFRVQTMYPVDETNPIASLKLSFEAITPMKAKLFFSVTDSLHSRFESELREFGAPLPISLPSTWITKNLSELWKSEGAIVQANNRWASDLAEAGFAQSLLEEHFDVMGSICLLRSNINVGSRDFTYELANSAAYERTLLLNAR